MLILKSSIGSFVQLNFSSEFTATPNESDLPSSISLWPFVSLLRDVSGIAYNVYLLVAKMSGAYDTELAFLS
jgi:hypothetical protein